MPYSLEKLQDFWGSGSLPIENSYGTTISNGTYSSKGVDINTLPGVMLLNPASGIFKKGPSDLFTSSSIRSTWWGAKIDDENNPAISIYKVIANSYAVLSHTTPILSKFPRSFDFDFYADGHVIIIAEYDEQLYGYYSFDSGSGWQLIPNSSPALTPKILFVDNSCMVTCASYSTEEIDYPRTQVVQYANEIKYTFVSSSVSCSGFDTYTHPEINTTTIAQDWTNRGHLSGTMSGLFDGSMFGTFSGSFGASIGNRIFARPASYRGNYTGDLTGSFSGYLSGYFSGSLPSIINVGSGIFSGSVSGTVNGIPHTNESGLWSGSIIGIVDGWALTDEQLLVQNLAFISDLVEVSSGRIQLTYGIYNVSTQSVTYYKLTSGIIINNGQAGSDGAPCSFEIIQPQDWITTPSLDVLDLWFWDPPGSDGITTYTATFIKGYSTDSYLKLNLRGWTGTARLVYTFGNTAAQWYYNYNMPAGISILKKTMASQVSSEWINFPSTAPYTILPHTNNQPDYFEGIIFPSSSLSDLVFQGTHLPLVSGSSYAGTRMISSIGFVDSSGSWTGSGENLGIVDGGISPGTHTITTGLKGRLYIGDGGTVNVRGTLFVNGATSSVVTYNNVADNQLLKFGLPSFTWTSNNGVYPEPYNSSWYPNVTLVLSVSGSLAYPIQQTFILNSRTYMLSVTNI